MTSAIKKIKMITTRTNSTPDKLHTMMKVLLHNALFFENDQDLCDIVNNNNADDVCCLRKDAMIHRKLYNHLAIYDLIGNNWDLIVLSEPLDQIDSASTKTSFI